MENKFDYEKLRLVVFKSAEELGNRINDQLLRMYDLPKDKNTFLVPINEIYFQDGHLKIEINESVRGKDLYFITDVGNYSLEYNMHGFTNHTSPNDLISQLKDGIGACNRHAQSINIIMPLLYAGRQHRRNGRENLACGAMLRELDRIKGIESLITFDVHDQGVEHATENIEFDNIFATNAILEEFINNSTPEELRRLVFVAPDNGATGRRNVYLNSFNSPFILKEAGSYIKQRDYNNLVDGKYPITGHDYSGDDDLTGKVAIVSDDMISSGGSMFDVIDDLCKKGISGIYIMVTFALFTKGIEEFNKYYNEGKLSGVYTTNLSYIPKEYLSCPWLHVCDCSALAAEVIYDIHNDLSISGLLTDRSYPVRLLEKKFLNEKSD